MKMRDRIKMGFIADQEARQAEEERREERPFMFAREKKKKPRDEREQDMNRLWDLDEDMQ